MMYYIFYRSENSDYIKQRTGRKDTCIKTEFKSKDKKECIKYAVNMNNHIKKFHNDRFGKDVYFVRGENEGCFFQIANNPTWTRMDCQYFGCLRAQTGCDLYNKLNDF